MKKNKVSPIFHFPNSFPPNSQVPIDLKRQIKEGYRKGIITIVAAGNLGPLPDTMNPLAKLPEVISVGATSKDGKTLAGFSSRGLPNNVLNRPTIVAPGINIISIWDDKMKKTKKQETKDKELITSEEFFLQDGERRNQNELNLMFNELTVMSGTSQASAIVVGIVSLIIHERDLRNLSVTPKSIARVLKDLAQPMNSYNDYEVGYGFVCLATWKNYIKKVKENRRLPEKTRILWSK